MKRPSRRSFGLNLNTLSLILIIFISFSIFWNFFAARVDSKEISLTEFVENVENNEYSTVEIRDDGKAFAVGKYLITTELADESATQLPGGSESLRVFSRQQENFTEIDLDKFYELLTPVTFSDLLDNLRNNRQIVQPERIFLGEDIILVENPDSFGNDYYVLLPEDYNLNQELKAEGIDETQITVEINRLNIVSRQVGEQEFLKTLENNQIAKIWRFNGAIIAAVNEGVVTRHSLNWSSFTNDFSKFLQEEGIDFNSDNEGFNTEFTSVVIARVPWGDIITIVILLGFGLLGILMFRGIQGSGSQLMKFGKSKARLIFGKKPEVTFKDVAGVDEAKEELREVVMFLREPKRFLDVGARIPKGLLMVGPPGTGKTLLARAIAGEAGVPFFHTSGSEFEEMLVGAGASRVRDLFEKAKKSAPSIIFIDEIDAVARKRGTTIQSGTTEQTLNQILVEMDGFEKNTNVIVIAATNRPDVLDAAILRPGRFDRRIVLDLPDIEGRKQIIQIHAKNKPLAKDLDITKVAKRTVGFSGADLENMLNEAAIIVAKDNRKEIVFADIEEAANKVTLGPARKRKRTEKELEMTAYHEAGHALVMKKVPEHDPVHRVTIISRGMALGYTMPLPESDKVSMSRLQMVSKITALMAGHAAEELIYGQENVTSGAANDIEKASDIARRMVKNFGMSDKLGMVKYGQEENLQYLGHKYGEDRDYSENTAQVIDEEVREIINNSYEQAKQILEDNRSILDEIVKVLLEKEVLEAEEFNRFFENLENGDATNSGDTEIAQDSETDDKSSEEDGAEVGSISKSKGSE